MALYSITYDLVKDRNYPELYKAIKLLCSEDWAKPTESQWIVKSNNSSEQIRNYLMNFVDGDDVLFVVQLHEESWSSFNITQGVSGWLKRAAR